MQTNNPIFTHLPLLNKVRARIYNSKTCVTEHIEKSLFAYRYSPRIITKSALLVMSLTLDTYCQTNHPQVYPEITYELQNKICWEAGGINTGGSTPVPYSLSRMCTTTLANLIRKASAKTIAKDHYVSLYKWLPRLNSLPSQHLMCRSCNAKDYYRHMDSSITELLYQLNSDPYLAANLGLLAPRGVIQPKEDIGDLEREEAHKDKRKKEMLIAARQQEAEISEDEIGNWI